MVCITVWVNPALIHFSVLLKKKNEQYFLKNYSSMNSSTWNTNVNTETINDLNPVYEIKILQH